MTADNSLGTLAQKRLPERPMICAILLSPVNRTHSFVRLFITFIIFAELVNKTHWTIDIRHAQCVCADTQIPMITAIGFGI